MVRFSLRGIPSLLSIPVIRLTRMSPSSQANIGSACFYFGSVPANFTINC